MPEVVEVAITAFYLDYKLKGKQITNITVLGGRYKRHPLKGLSEFKNSLPFTIDSVSSKGKFMWFSLSNDKGPSYLLNRFGLEGEWTFQKKTHSNIEFEIKHATKDKTYHLYFTDSRNFGTVSFTTKVADLDKELDKLQPDLLKDEFTNEQFYERMKRYLHGSKDSIIKSRADQKIVKVLMDQQSELGSGIGNYLAVEILYRAKISPHTTIGTIYNDRRTVYRLAESIKYIIKLAFLTADVGYFTHLDPKIDTFVKALRNDIKNDTGKYHFHTDTDIGTKKFKFLVYRQKKDPKGNDVTPDKIITGRTTYWVPAVQK